VLFVGELHAGDRARRSVLVGLAHDAGHTGKRAVYGLPGCRIDHLQVDSATVPEVPGRRPDAQHLFESPAIDQVDVLVEFRRERHDRAHQTVRGLGAGLGASGVSTNQLDELATLVIPPRTATMR
jgi:hypothetical protein